MNIISQEQFLTRKTSDIIFVLGSGWSVNKVSQEEWDIVSQYDSIGFNWFCKHQFEPTFFLIREQSNLPHRKHKGETIKALIKRVNRYKETCCVICDVKHHTPRAYSFKKDKRIKTDCVVMRDDNNRKHSRKLHKYFTKNPFKHGLVHGRCTMFNVLHLATWLQYKHIAFLGVDLRDSRYFWLDKKETRHTVAKKGRSYRHRHAITQDTLRLIKKCKKYLSAQMYVTFKKSLLTRKIPYKTIQQIYKDIPPN